MDPLGRKALTRFTGRAPERRQPAAARPVGPGHSPAASTATAAGAERWRGDVEDGPWRALMSFLWTERQAGPALAGLVAAGAAFVVDVRFGVAVVAGSTGAALLTWTPLGHRLMPNLTHTLWPDAFTAEDQWPAVPAGWQDPGTPAGRAGRAETGSGGEPVAVTVYVVTEQDEAAGLFVGQDGERALSAGTRVALPSFTPVQISELAALLRPMSVEDDR